MVADSFDLLALLTIFSTIFVAELTDKDALLILSLATTKRPKTVFLAGCTAFLTTTAIIVTLSSLLVRVVPILWVKVAGGGIMLAYALWESRQLVTHREDESIGKREEKLAGRFGIGIRAFLGMVSMLIALDLAGDATEVLTVVFVARFGNLLLVFGAASLALIAATAVETTLGSMLRRALSPRRLQMASVGIFLLLGTYILVASLLA